MAVASLQVKPAPQLGPDVRRVTLDCPHGTTQALVINPRAETILSEQDVVRYALIRHHQEEGCRCIRRLWRRVFGCPWPEVRLATGTPG